MGTLEVGQWFWEYNKGVGYKRKAHHNAHIEYFWKGYKVITFFTKEELLSVYPQAIID